MKPTTTLLSALMAASSVLAANTTATPNTTATTTTRIPDSTITAAAFLYPNSTSCSSGGHYFSGLNKCETYSLSFPAGAVKYIGKTTSSGNILTGYASTNCSGDIILAQGTDFECYSDFANVSFGSFKIIPATDL